MSIWRKQIFMFWFCGVKRECGSAMSCVSIQISTSFCQLEGVWSMHYSLWVNHWLPQVNFTFTMIYDNMMIHARFKLIFMDIDMNT